MKKLLILATALALGTVFTASTAQCFGCGTATCYNSSSCFSGCVCLKSGNDAFGTCAKIN